MKITCDSTGHSSLLTELILTFSLFQGHLEFFMVVSSMWMPLNIGRALNSGWELQLQVDATFKVCTEAIGVLGFGVNSLGAHMNLVCAALIPDNRESE